MKKIIYFSIFILVTFCSSIGVFAKYSDISTGAFYLDSINRISDLGIICGNGDGTFEPNEMLLREQFAKVIILSSNQADYADFFQNQRSFPDVAVNEWSNKYIGAAFKKGYLLGMPNGNFEPYKKISYGEVCTVIVRMLGYQNADLPGYWPYNYITKASELGLTKDIKFAANDGLPRWAIAVMLDRLLNTNIKKAQSTSSDELFGVSTHLFKELVILEDSKTSSSLSANEINTNLGVFNTSNLGELKAGNTYRVKISDENKIEKFYGSIGSTKTIIVNDYEKPVVSYTEDGTTKTYSLSQNTVYYFGGEKVTFSSLEDLLNSGYTINLIYTQRHIEPIYGVIFDPNNSVAGTLGEYIVLGSHSTDNTIQDGYVLTDNGILEQIDTSKNLELGTMYKFIVKDGKINLIFNQENSTKQVVVRSASGEYLKIFNTEGNEDFVLPKLDKYFYNGSIVTYTAAEAAITMNSAIVFGYNDLKTGYSYGVIYDPVYSAPVIVTRKGVVTGINTTGVSIIKNSDIIYSWNIYVDDVVCEVTDVFNTQRYVLVVDDRYFGYIEGYTPSRLSPDVLVLNEYNFDNHKYGIINLEFGKYFDKSTISESDLWKVDQDVWVFVGYDGKIVRIKNS